MPRGGKRAGAGRPKGGHNKLTYEAVETTKDTGQTPLQYLLEIMRDTTADRKDRVDAAKAAAPYVHHKLNATTLTGEQLVKHIIEIVEVEEPTP